MTNAAVYEYLVAGSALLAVLPVGCSVGYPSVLLHQLASNESTIHLDWETASWIGSIHGIAGVPSIIMPAFMQWRGRKLAFTLACLISIIGWIIAYTATNTTAILISESFHGFGSQSIMAVGMLSLSEMVSPRIRSFAMCLYLVLQTLGMAVVGILGNYMHWQNVTLVICAPLIVVAVAVIFIWPESPSWLAYKGEFDKCAKSFTRLRGKGHIAQVELEELILAQKENLSRENNSKKQSIMKHFWITLKSRDFYLPGLHLFIFSDSLYWTGSIVTMVYLTEVIQRSTFTKEAVTFGYILLNSVMFIGCVVSTILIRYFPPKKVFAVSISGTVISLLVASGVHYSQTFGYLSKESYICLYILAVFMFVACLGLPIVVTVSAELMPVKHRGIGGPLYVISTCVLHTSSMKLGPYLFKYTNMWGTWLIYALNGALSGFFICKYIPETKGRTLQQLEDYYAYGNIDKRRRNDVQDEMKPIKD